MKSLRKISATVLAASVLVFGAPHVAVADDSSYNDTVKELVRLNPGSTYNSMNQAINEEARTQGKTPHTVASEALAEARSHIVDSGSEISTRSSKSGEVKLKKAGVRGDIFYSPSATGHVGIYYKPAVIVEAPGPGQKAQSKHINQKKVKKNTELLRVRTSQANRNKAADKAWTYRGRAYNIKGFAFNKTANGKMNCSQLVWAAYKTTTGIDLDADGGHGVYPRDIRNSSWTYTYKTITQ